jgi:hypothetical protein
VSILADYKALYYTTRSIGMVTSGTAIFVTCVLLFLNMPVLRFLYVTAKDDR